ncbi:hypothetical protein Tco_0161696 [Tanacetum coccineum]
MEKTFQIFQDLRFEISFADALLLSQDLPLTIKNLLMNKEKLFELAKIPLNENCSAMLLKKLPEKLGDPGNLTSFETSDSLLEEFANELALLDPFPPGNEDVDFEAELREIELLFNRDPPIDFSPNITIDPNPESDINPLFNEILEDFVRKDSNVSNFNEPVLLNTPLFDEDECFDPGGEIDKIDAFMDAYNDSEGDVLEILHNTTHNLFPEVFFDHKPQGLKDEPDNDDLMAEDKVFDPGVMEKFFSTSYVRLSSKDRHYLFFIIVFSFGSEDTIFDPGIYAFYFSSFDPVAFESQMEVFSSTCFSPMNN